MATNILGLMDYVQQQGDLGLKQGQQQSFNRLAGQAYTAPAAQQGALVGQMVGIDPQAGVAVGNALTSRNQAVDTDHMKKLGGAARYMASALQTKNPAQIEGAYQNVRPYLAQVSGKEPPPQWDPAMEPALYQAIAQTGGDPTVKGVVANQGAQVIDPATGRVMASVPFSQKYQNVPMGAGQAAGTFDPNTGTVRPAVGGEPQGQQAPQRDPMQPFIDQANAAIKMGAPQAQVETWLKQQAQQIGAQPQAPGQSPYMASSNVAGLVSPGNINLSQRPTVKNADGSISTVRSISIGTDKGEVLIPTVIGNRVVSNEEAIRHYQQTGENLGTFTSPQSANAYAETLHEQQAQEYLPQQAGQPPAQFGIGTPKPVAADTFAKNKSFADQLRASGAITTPEEYNEVLTTGKVGSSFQGNADVKPFGDETKTGVDYLGSLAGGNADIVKGLLNGTVQLPTGTALKNGFWQSALASVKHADPTWNQAAYKQFADTRKYMTTGKGGALINSINTGAQHLQKLVDDINALDNSNSRALAAGSNYLSENFGGQAVTNFQGDVTPVASELASIYKNGGTPTDQETQHWRDALTVNMSRGQQLNIVRGWIDLLAGKLNAMHSQYQASMSPLSEPLNVINPKAAQALEQITKLGNAVSTTGQHPTPAMDQTPVNAPGNQSQQPSPAQGGQPRAVNATGHAVVWNGSAWVSE